MTQTTVLRMPLRGGGVLVRRGTTPEELIEVAKPGDTLHLVDNTLLDRSTTEALFAELDRQLATGQFIQV